MRKFQEVFFSQSMNQHFNRAGTVEAASEHEPPLRKRLRLEGQLWQPGE
jgi:hypothetical protein